MVDFLAKNKVTEAYEEVDLDEAPRRKGAPKMGGDSIAIQRAKDSRARKGNGTVSKNRP